MKRSKIIAEAVRTGQLLVVGAHYNINDGHVKMIDPPHALAVELVSTCSLALMQRTAMM